MPAVEPDLKHYVTRGEFAEFREEVRGSLSEVTRSLKSVPTKEDMASAIRSEVGASRQVSPASIAAAVAVALMFAGLYARDQSNSAGRLEDFRRVVEDDLNEIETATLLNREMVGDLRVGVSDNKRRIGGLEMSGLEVDRKLQREQDLISQKMEQIDIRLQREMDLKDELVRERSRNGRQAP